MTLHLCQHEADRAPGYPTLWVQVVQVIHDELQNGRGNWSEILVSHLTAGSEVSSVELIWDVPSKRTKLLPLLKTFDIA